MDVSWGESSPTRGDQYVVKIQEEKMQTIDSIDMDIVLDRGCFLLVGSFPVQNDTICSYAG